MSTAAQSTRVRIGDLAVLGGLLMAIDTLWGAVAVLPFDWSRPLDIALGVGLVSGLPAFVLDFRSRRRVVIFLPIVFVLRWMAGSYQATPPHFGRPWIGGSVLLIAATVLLQWSKLRVHARSVSSGPRSED